MQALRGAVIYLTLCMAHIYNAGMVEEEERARNRAGKSKSVYLLFSSALTAHDQLALLNWALSTHIAALKPPDG